MTLSDELDILRQILDAARERLDEGDERARPIVIAVEAMVSERETSLRAMN
jgi:CHAD domain-containing protein